MTDFLIYTLLSIVNSEVNRKVYQQCVKCMPTFLVILHFLFYKINTIVYNGNKKKYSLKICKLYGIICPNL